MIRGLSAILMSGAAVLAMAGFAAPRTGWLFFPETGGNIGA